MSQVERLRLFVAIELPEEWHNALAREEQALEAAAPGYCRWVDPRVMHVTLAFLGWQPAVARPTIERAVEAAAAAAPTLTLSLDRLGSFGGRRSLRVLWLGVKDAPAGALAAVRAGVVAALQEGGIGVETEPFRAHITLARARRDATASQSEAVYQALGSRSAPRVQRHQCAEITLMRSDLRPTGAVYTPLFRAPLGEGLQRAV